MSSPLSFHVVCSLAWFPTLANVTSHLLVSDVGMVAVWDNEHSLGQIPVWILIHSFCIRIISYMTVFSGMGLNVSLCKNDNMSEKSYVQSAALPYHQGHEVVQMYSKSLLQNTWEHGIPMGRISVLHWNRDVISGTRCWLFFPCP